MSGIYGENGLSGTLNSNDNFGNGVRQIFDVFDNSRQFGESDQYGQYNQYDTTNHCNLNTFNTLFGGDNDGE